MTEDLGREARTARTPQDGDRSIGELVGEVANDLTSLMRQEVQLAKTEIKQEAVTTGKAAGLLGAAGFAGYMTLLFVSVAGWWALGESTGHGWSALVVALVWAVIGAVCYVTGRARLRRVNPMPERTVNTLKDVPQALRGR
jgi:hypothetical protein